MKKAIFFDLDGVLVLTEPIHLLGWHEVMAELSIPKDYFRLEEVVGLSDFSMAEDLISNFKLKFTPIELCSRKIEKYLELLKTNLSSPHGRNDFLNKLKEKYKLIIVSSSTRKEIEVILKYENLAHYFDFYLGFEDTKEHKPNPAPYLLALKRANLLANDVVVFEDSPAGITAAVSAKIKVIGLATTIPSFPERKEIVFYKDFSSIPIDKIE
jgi:HAD superfamily hydrolase (TIGR01509 family)